MNVYFIECVYWSYFIRWTWCVLLITWILYCWSCVLLVSFCPIVSFCSYLRAHSQVWDNFRQLKALWQWGKMFFISPEKLLFSRYLSFCLDFLVIYKNGFITNNEVNFKIYDVKNSITNNYNTHTTRYLKK